MVVNNPILMSMITTLFGLALLVTILGWTRPRREPEGVPAVR